MSYGPNVISIISIGSYASVYRYECGHGSNSASNGQYIGTNMPAIIIIDLGFGDAGKGSMVDYYARKTGAHTVVRFNGGAQAAHHVVLPSGKHHSFSQFGSGTFAGADTYLSKYMLFDPISLVPEAEHLAGCGVDQPYSYLAVNEDALVVTPFQRAANRLRESSRGNGRHGSCGMGIGETMADQLVIPHLCLKVGELRYKDIVYQKLAELQKYKRTQMAGCWNGSPEERILKSDDAVVEFGDRFLDCASRIKIVGDEYLDNRMSTGTVIFEGAQGVLIDEWYGFHPHTTWSTTTFENAMSMLRGYKSDIIRVGVTRGYAVRHGPGPFPTEDKTLDLPERHNDFNPWQREFRTGWLDLNMLGYALKVVGGVNHLDVTCLDRLADRHIKVCTDYEDTEGAGIKVRPAPNLEYQRALGQALSSVRCIYQDTDIEEILDIIECDLGVDIGTVSYGNTFEAKYALHPEIIAV